MTRPSKKPAFSEIQAEIYRALTEGGLTVFDEASENQPFPYLTIGESSVSEDATKTENADEHIETINIWSRYKGFKQCKDLASEAVELISGHDYSAIAGYKVRFIEIESVVFLRDPDGLTRRGVVRPKYKAIQE